MNWLRRFLENRRQRRSERWFGNMRERKVVFTGPKRTSALVRPSHHAHDATLSRLAPIDLKGFASEDETAQVTSNHLACTVWGTAESHRVLFRPDVGCPYCEISHQANEIERLEECIRGMSAYAMKASAEETRLREALKWIEDHAFDVERIGLAEKATNTLRAADETTSVTTKGD